MWDMKFRPQSLKLWYTLAGCYFVLIKMRHFFSIWQNYSKTICSWSWIIFFSQKFDTSSNVACKTFRFCAQFTALLSQNQLAIFNLDRFLAAYKCQWYSDKLMHNKNYCITTFVANVVMSLALSIHTPLAFSYDEDLDSCWMPDNSVLAPYVPIKLAVEGFFFILFPLLFILPSNCYISRKMK